ncbi:MAG TPA: hypothetical protein VKR06_38025 [Ktedonosporobacter sp.]|nr:hypothetical protein [Ktedonosporobacter sp.]
MGGPLAGLWLSSVAAITEARKGSSYAGNEVHKEADLTLATIIHQQCTR